MERREYTSVVECYATHISNHHPNEEMGYELDQPGYIVRGRKFSRLIYRPIGRPDVLVAQVRDPGDLYEYFEVLPNNVMQNRDNLFQGIVANPPPIDVRVVPDEFLHLGWTWQNFAFGLSQFAEATYFNNSDPFLVEGDEAFGNIVTMLETSRWSNSTWLQNPPPQIVVPECGICLAGDIAETPIHDLLGLHCCQHVYHRTCILKWVWENYEVPSCPTCNRRI